MPIVIKKMNHKTTDIMRSIKIAGKKMDRNLKILKETMAEGVKKGCLKDKLLLLSNDFEQSIVK